MRAGYRGVQSFNVPAWSDPEIGFVFRPNSALVRHKSQPDSY
jgi:hypothetical protein